MTLEGIDGREAAEGLRGVELAVPRAELPEPTEGEWYFVDLIGLRAVDARGEAVGEVIDVVSYPSIDCLVVRMADGIREVPVVEPWLVAIDVDGGRVTVGDIADFPIQREKRAPR
jgi:16S rRNA processing protein RimM